MPVHLLELLPYMETEWTFIIGWSSYVLFFENPKTNGS